MFYAHLFAFKLLFLIVYFELLSSIVCWMLSSIEWRRITLNILMMKSIAKYDERSVTKNVVVMEEQQRKYHAMYEARI